MKRCDEYFENLSAYLDGEMPENSIKDIEEHLSKCENCSEELSMLKTIISALNELEEELPDGFETSLHKRLAEAGAKSGVKIKSGKVRLFSQIAAGFVIILCVGFAIKAGLMRAGTKSAAPSSGMPSMSVMQSTPSEGFDAAVAMHERIADAEIYESPDAVYGDYEAGAFRVDGSIDRNGASPGNVTGIQGAQVDQDMTVPCTDAAPYAEKEEGRDTLVTITSDDAQIVLEKIIEIESKINQAEQFSNIAGLNRTLDAVNAETYASNKIEVKLFYYNNITWHEFLTEVKANFPEVHIEFAPKTEDVEYIRITIEQR